jgi:cystathionine beta-lyase/cystathionine gamma-synthase
LSHGQALLSKKLMPFQVLLSNKVNYWTGQECREFEKEFADFVGTQYAVALANGTVALDVALKALGIGAGDDVIVTSRTFWLRRVRLLRLVPIQYLLMLS